MKNKKSYIEIIDGDTYYYNELNQLHREDGPALIRENGSMGWYLNDKLHREDGPAVVWLNGDKEWFYHGERIEVKSQKEFERYVKLMVFK